MTNTELQKAFNEYRSKMFVSSGTLTDFLSRVRPGDSANTDAWADALMHGLKAGDELAKAFQGMAFDTERFFHANGSELNEAEFQKAAEEMNLYIAEHPDRFQNMKSCPENMQSASELAVKLLQQHNELLYKTAFLHQKSYDELLTNPGLYACMTCLISDTLDLIPAACFLLSGLDANAIAEEDACSAAYQFGFITGVSRESVRQAVESFDADAFKSDMCRYDPALKGILVLAILAAVGIGAKAVLAFSALFEGFALVEILSSILVFFAVTAAAAGVLCLPVFYFIYEYTAAARKIEKESVDRTKSILQRIDAQHTSLNAPHTCGISIAEEPGCICE